MSNNAMQAETLVSKVNLDYLELRRTRFPKLKDELRKYFENLEKQAKKTKKQLFYILIETKVKLWIVIKYNAQKPREDRIDSIEIYYKEFFNSYTKQYSEDLFFIKFNFQSQNENSTLQLKNLSFDDLNHKLIFNGYDISLNPQFQKEEDYLFVKDQILKVKKELGL